MTATLRGGLDGYVSLASHRPQSVEAVYQEVLAWKGAVFSFQRLARVAASQPELAPLRTELEDITHQLAVATFAIPETGHADEWRQQLVQLRDRKERLETELARQSTAFRRQQRSVRPADLQAALPRGAVLVDFLEYRHLSTTSGKGTDPRSRLEPHLAAFVVRGEGQIVLCDLGSVTPIAEAIDRWRAVLWQRRFRATCGQCIREQVWTPLAEHLQGAEQVLVSPDGALARFPLAALPGDNPGSYLIEDVRLAVVPVPQVLAFQDPAKEEVPASLLLVGQVDYGATPDTAPQLAAADSDQNRPRSDVLNRWQPLPNSRAEVLAIEDSFSQRYPTGLVKVLRHAEPTEEVFCTEAPQYCYLHLATHGFFAPAELCTRLGATPAEGRPAATTKTDPCDPGLLSGVVLANANQSVREGQNDGILFASEVAALDLTRVQLAVLSACETGLGELSAGEGALGLQRAFQVAGTAASWPVSGKCPTMPREA